jgi:hypothetical protein
VPLPAHSMLLWLRHVSISCIISFDVTAAVEHVQLGSHTTQMYIDMRTLLYFGSGHLGKIGC